MSSSAVVIQNSTNSFATDYSRALLNILDDFGDERKRLEDMQSAVLNILEDLETEKQKAQEANRQKSEFLANMSHELRTPLNAIMGFTKLIWHGKAGPISAQQEEFLGDIFTSSNHLLQLINDVLDLAKIEAGKTEFYPVPVEPAALIEEVRSILRTVAANKQIVIETEIDVSCTGVIIDPSKFKQILFNYLSNALKFTPDRGEVLVRVRNGSAGTFRVEVRDTGIGIRPEDIPTLFTEFRQLDSGGSNSKASRKDQGTGLGLSLTRHIVEAQGGRVGVESSLGAGSTFFAELPTRPLEPVSGRA